MHDSNLEALKLEALSLGLKTVARGGHGGTDTKLRFGHRRSHMCATAYVIKQDLRSHAVVYHKRRIVTLLGRARKDQFYFLLLCKVQVLALPGLGAASVRCLSVAIAVGEGRVSGRRRTVPAIITAAVMQAYETRHQSPSLPSLS